LGLSPPIDPAASPRFHVADIRDQLDIARIAARSESSEIDDAMYRLFKSIKPEWYKAVQDFADDGEVLAADELAITCATKLLGKGHDKEFEAYCVMRLDDLRGKPADARVTKLRRLFGQLRAGTRNAQPR
jgi:hypothetical protein